MVPAALRSLTRSSRVVLGWLLTVLMTIDTPRGAILHGAPVRVRLRVILCFFHLRINGFHLLTKLLGDDLLAHSSLVYVYNLVPDILGQLFGLGHGEFGSKLIDCFCGQVAFSTGKKLRLWAIPFKRVLLISATYLYKRHMAARHLADWSGIKYLFHSSKCKSIYNFFLNVFFSISFVVILCLTVQIKLQLKL